MSQRWRRFGRAQLRQRLSETLKRWKCTDRHKSASTRQATNGNTQVWRCSVVLGVHSCISCELSRNLKLFFQTAVSNMIPSPPPFPSQGGASGRSLRSLKSSSVLLFLPLPSWPCDAAAAPLPRGAFGLGEGLLVRVLLGMHLLVQAVGGQFVALFNFQLKHQRTSVWRSKHWHSLTCSDLRTKQLFAFNYSWKKRQENYQDSFGDQPSYLCWNFEHLSFESCSLLPFSRLEV